MEPAEFTEEKFALYKDYQLNVHKDKDKAPSSFKNFLCDSDLEVFLSTCWDYIILTGLYSGHLLNILVQSLLTCRHIMEHTINCIELMESWWLWVYWISFLAAFLASILCMPLNGIGVSLERWPLFRILWNLLIAPQISVLREAALAREMHLAGLKSIGWAYLGFYVHSCPKMKYKGEYFPSFLLDPVSD